MITGLYGQASGAFLTATVYFPVPVDELLEVAFLVDSGAADTCISLTDLLRQSMEAARKIEIRPRRALRGVGGATPGLSTRAHIALTHEDSAVSHLELDVALLLDPNVLGLPSVLGRDVLYRGHLHFDPSAGGVYFDAPKGSFVI